MVACGSNASSYQGKKMVSCRRMWTKPEEDVLVQSLKEIISTGWKADNCFRVGYLDILQDKIMRAFPRTDLRANPHISSKMHSWKKQYNSLYTIFGGTGVGWNPTSKMIDTVDDAAWETACKNEPNAHTMRHKSWPYYDSWCEVFGKDRANGTGAEDFHDALNGVLHNESQLQTPNDVLHNESQPQTPLGPNLEDMDTAYTPGVEEVGTTSFCQPGSSSTTKQAKKGKRKKDDGVIGPIMEGINKFTDKIDSRLDEKLVATNMIVKNTQVLAMFFSLPESAKAGQAMAGQVPQGDGWTVRKEIFFIDLLNEARGRNEIMNGQMANHVVEWARDRINAEFGGFNTPSIVNQFDMLRQRCKMVNLIMSDNAFQWDRRKNWISAPKSKWKFLIEACFRYSDASKYELCEEMNWEKLREVFDDDLGDGDVDHRDNTHGSGYQSENEPIIVPDPDYLEYLICMYFKYDLE
ncbi:hypothetical protein BUALT_Bualt02G0075600 [Buddleja alternifolia]|uniref:Myb/SANT-like domain-containing protein n=1 Tax=Buddleja alternifolia TaxID=168488 RepID=A0AAV6Y503_9LAMI|nr:hypothetical protein BUALT_Bualt02G0075600 [Buddleja alternifolia]